MKCVVSRRIVDGLELDPGHGSGVHHRTLGVPAPESDRMTVIVSPNSQGVETVAVCLLGPLAERVARAARVFGVYGTQGPPMGWVVSSSESTRASALSVAREELVLLRDFLATCVAELDAAREEDKRGEG